MGLGVGKPGMGREGRWELEGRREVRKASSSGSGGGMLSGGGGGWVEGGGLLRFVGASVEVGVSLGDDHNQPIGVDCGRSMMFGLRYEWTSKMRSHGLLGLAIISSGPF